MKPLGETSLSFVLCCFSLSHDDSPNLPVSNILTCKKKLRQAGNIYDATACNMGEHDTVDVFERRMGIF